MTPETAFSRKFLAEVHKDLKKLHGVGRVMEAWVYHTSFPNTWDFHYRDFYWYGRADNAYDARIQGWLSWIRKQEESK